MPAPATFRVDVSRLVMATSIVGREIPMVGPREAGLLRRPASDHDLALGLEGGLAFNQADGGQVGVGFVWTSRHGLTPLLNKHVDVDGYVVLQVVGGLASE